MLISADDSIDSHHFALSTKMLITSDDGRKMARDLTYLTKEAYETIMLNTDVEKSDFELRRAVRVSWVVKSQFSQLSHHVCDLIDTGLASGALVAAPAVQGEMDLFCSY